MVYCNARRSQRPLRDSFPEILDLFQDLRAIQRSLTHPADKTHRSFGFVVSVFNGVRDRFEGQWLNGDGWEVGEKAHSVTI